MQSIKIHLKIRDTLRRSRAFLVQILRDISPIHRASNRLTLLISDTRIVERTFADKMKQKRAKTQLLLDQLQADMDDFQARANDPSSESSEAELRLLSRRIKASERRMKRHQATFDEYELLVAANTKAIDKQFAKYGRAIVFSFIFFFVLVLVLTYAYYKMFVPGFGQGVSSSYYQTVAQILPLLLVAIFLNGTPDPADDKKPKSAWYRVNFRGKLEGLLSVTIGEVACLIAISYNISGTMLLVITIYSLLVVTGLAYAKIIHGSQE